MADIEESLWPANFLVPTQTPPLVILREQASQLGRQTRNLVEGEVDTTDFDDGRLVHGFQVRAMALNGYSYTLFYVEHDVGLYPVLFHQSMTAARKKADPMSTCNTPEEFKAKLRDIFASDETRRIIGAMLAQS